MADGIRIVRERQLAIRRELDRRSISLKVISFDSKVKLPTLASYFPRDGVREPANMPVSAIFCLSQAKSFPLDLLSLLLPDELAIVRVPDGINHDDVAAACGEYQAAYIASRNPTSEQGIEIGSGERSQLDQVVTHLRSVVG